MRVSRVVAMWHSAELWCLPLVAHESVVAGGEGGVDAAGLVGGHEQGFTQRGVAGLGGWPVMAVDAGGVERRGPDR